MEHKFTARHAVGTFVGAGFGVFALNALQFLGWLNIPTFLLIIFTAIELGVTIALPQLSKKIYASIWNSITNVKITKKDFQDVWTVFSKVILIMAGISIVWNSLEGWILYVPFEIKCQIEMQFWGMLCTGVSVLYIFNERLKLKKNKEHLIVLTLLLLAPFNYVIGLFVLIGVITLIIICVAFFLLTSILIIILATFKLATIYESFVVALGIVAGIGIGVYMGWTEMQIVQTSINVTIGGLTGMSIAFLASKIGSFLFSYQKVDMLYQSLWGKG